MLLQFNFTNYKSFKNKVSLDMTAANITENNNHVVSIANEKLLKVAAIYGANASGKTNVYEALRFMDFYVSNSFSFGDSTVKQDLPDSKDISASPFMFDNKSINSPSTFEVFFINTSDSKTYQYGFAIKKNIIIEEWLFSKAKSSKEYRTIFYREENKETEYDTKIASSEQKFLNKALHDKSLLISLGAKLKINILEMVRNWFMNISVLSFGEPVEAFFRSTTIPPDFAENDAVQSSIVRYFNTFDDSITGFTIEKIDSEDNEAYKIDSIHNAEKLCDNNSIPLQEESAGTLKMFALYPYLKGVFETGGILVVDELNAKLHPLLVRNLIVTFLNHKININNAQMIFTTHDVWQLSTGLLRRDEIWFVNKDKNGVSDLYSLAEFKDEDGNKIRKDVAFEKNYLTGSYEAIPSLKPINIIGDTKNGH